MNDSSKTILLSVLVAITLGLPAWAGNIGDAVKDVPSASDPVSEPDANNSAVDLIDGAGASGEIGASTTGGSGDTSSTAAGSGDVGTQTLSPPSSQSSQKPIKQIKLGIDQNPGGSIKPGSFVDFVLRLNPKSIFLSHVEVVSVRSELIKGRAIIWVTLSVPADMAQKIQDDFAANRLSISSWVPVWEEGREESVLDWSEEPTADQIKTGKIAITQWPGSTGEARRRVAEQIVVGNALDGLSKTALLKTLGPDGVSCGEKKHLHFKLTKEGDKDIELVVQFDNDTVELACIKRRWTEITNQHEPEKTPSKKATGKRSTGNKNTTKMNTTKVAKKRK